MQNELQPILPFNEKIVSIAKECLKLPVQRYVQKHEKLFQEEKFNGCVAFIHFTLIGAGIPIPDFIGPDGIQRPMKHVNEFFDHFGVPIPAGTQKPGDLVFFSWDGRRPQHIGIVTENNYYIHAHTSDGSVKKNNLSSHPIKTDHLNTIYQTNPIGFKRPTIANKDPRWFQKPI